MSGELQTIWPWAALAGLGAFHGLNPAMGWLFAVALGLQTGERVAVLRALVPIALGHAASIAVVVALAGMALTAFDPAVLRVGAAIGLVGFGAWRLARGYRHRFLTGMVAGFGDLVVWSFLMATAHGAGLMVLPVLPVLLQLPICGPGGVDHASMLAVLGGSAEAGLAAVAVHTAAMLAVTGLIAWVVFDWIGLAILRKGWINLDVVWSGALIATGAVLLAFSGPAVLPI